MSNRGQWMKAGENMLPGIAVEGRREAERIMERANWAPDTLHVERYC
jgi:hypothetical protein